MVGVQAGRAQGLDDRLRELLALVVAATDGTAELSMVSPPDGRISRLLCTPPNPPVQPESAETWLGEPDLEAAMRSRRVAGNLAAG
jgi:hypothetical protein